MLDNNNYSSDKPSTSFAWPLAYPSALQRLQVLKKYFSAALRRQIKLAMDSVKKIKKVLCEVTRIKNVSSKTFNNHNMNKNMMW